MAGAKSYRSTQVIWTPPSEPRTTKEPDGRTALALASRFRDYTKIDQMCVNISSIDAVTGDPRATDSVLGTVLLQKNPEVGFIYTAYMLEAARRAISLGRDPSSAVIHVSNAINRPRVRGTISRFDEIAGVPEVVAQHLLGTIVYRDTGGMRALVHTLSRSFVLNGIESFIGMPPLSTRMANCYCHIAEVVRPPDAYLRQTHERVIEAKRESLDCVFRFLYDTELHLARLVRGRPLEEELVH